MKHVLAFAATTVAILVAWHLYAVVVVQSAVVLPTPLQVVDAFLSQIDVIAVAVAVTMAEAMTGFLFAAVAGYGLGLAFHLMPLLRSVLYPYAVALKATPLIAIAPILVLWTGDGIASKVLMSALVAFFPILVSSFSGFNRYGEEALVFYRTLGAPPAYILRKIVIPGSLPHLFSGLKIGSTLSVVGAVIAEFVGAQHGAGYLIKSNSYYLDTAAVLSTVIVLGLASVLFFQIIQWLEKRIIFWEKSTGI
jgi:NitT/TauT family transport system permease protein